MTYDHSKTRYPEAIGVNSMEEREVEESINRCVQTGQATTLTLIQHVMETYTGAQQTYGIFYIGYMWRLYREFLKTRGEEEDESLLNR